MGYMSSTHSMWTLDTDADKSTIKNLQALARWLSYLEHHPKHQKGCGFNSQAGHITRLWAPSLGGAHTGGSQLMLLPTL